MSSPRAEVNHCPAARDFNDPSRLGSNQRLKAHHAEQIGLDDLRFDQRSSNGEERFSGEYRCAFGKSEQIAGEAQSTESLEELRRDALELWKALQITNLFVGELEI